MSLINQMLRDLEQRSSQKPEPAQPLSIRTASDRRGGKFNRLWLLPLIASPLAYFWHQNQPGLPAPQPPAVTSPAAIANPAPPVITAAEPPALITPAPLAASSDPVPAPQATLAEPEKPAIKPEIAGKPVKPAVKAVEKPASLPPQKITAAQPAKTTTREQAESLYRQAQRSASVTMAKETLQDALELDPLYLPVRTLLLQTLLKAHASDAELSAFTENSLQLFPGNLQFIKARAHLYVQQKNFNAAVHTLEQIDADTVDDSAYLALLAAGYQQLQRFPQAARIYQQLTRIQPDKAENWLGLAIAQDKLNQTQPAVQAYRQALDKKTLNTEVVDYIKQRLSALN